MEQLTSNISLFNIVMVAGFVLLSSLLYRLKRKLDGTATTYSDTQQQIAKLSTQLVEAQKQLDLYKRPRGSLFARWVTPKEDESAYVLSIYNDSNERVFNVDVVVPKPYKSACQVYITSNYIDPDSWLEIAILPQRQEFAQLWFNDAYKPIAFHVRYTESPALDNPKTCPAPFKVSYASKHFSEYLKRLVSDNESTKSSLRTPPLS